ncbi:MAG: hypothetical protein HQ567_21460 [Candidatus Nealsonbacteria bacterium]|nr:hypothetical protein [Candidatus Nealsonbacteria bacterium]
MKIFKTLKVHWLPLVKTVVPVVVPLAGYWALKKDVDKAWEFLRQLSRPGDATLGCLIILLIVVLIGAALWWLFKSLLTSAPFSVDVHLSLNRVLRQFRSHFVRTIAVSRPDLRPVARRRRWNELVAVTLEGISDDRIMNMYCEAGQTDRPLLFCNFQSYAHAVAKLLDHVATEAAKMKPPRPQVWTIFKRPVCNWYNTFPVEWIDNGQVLRGQVTFDWWEEYKAHIAELKGPDSKIQLHRIVVNLDYKGDSDELGEYYLYDLEPLDIRTAIEKAKVLGETVKWHRSISQLLGATDLNGKEGLAVFLIGKPAGEATLPDDHKLLFHFQNSFHDGHKPISDEDGGVYVGYVPEKGSVPAALAVYNDVFIVKLTDQERFGLAFVDDDTRDINGIRLLPQYQLRTSETDRDSETAYESFVNAFHDSESEWQSGVGAS